jgi:hypothetical protein
MSTRTVSSTLASLALAALVGRAAAAQAALTSATTAPQEVSGVLVPEAGGHLAGEVPGALLLVPRLAIAAASVPLRAGLIVYERQNVRERVLDLFFDDTRTFGVYPTASLETGLRPGIGARLVHRNLFSTGAHLRLSADYGGELRRRLDAGVSNIQLGPAPLWAHLRGGWQRQPDASFYGIGDAPLAASDSDAAGLPARGPAAYQTRFDQTIRRLELGVVFDPAGPLRAGWSGSYVARGFGSGDALDPRQIDTRFDPSSLPGWDRGVALVYNELQVGLDRLRVTSPYVAAGVPSAGNKVLAFAGWASGVGGDPTRYLRYGVDALQYFDLYQGSRVLMLRGHLEGVAGETARIPFTDLPRLGGPLLLRGFAPNRFRDRVVLSATAEYRYPIWRQMSGFLFADVGRVLPGAADLAPGRLVHERPHVGGGGGLEILQGNDFRLRGQAATSGEGLFFQLAFEPAYRVQTPAYRI